MNKSAFTVIVLAGQRPGIDPLAAHFGQPIKALVEVAGRPMLSWVVDSLSRRKDTRRIVVLAQQADALLRHADTARFADDPAIILRDCGNYIADAITGTVRSMPDGYPFLVTTADNVLLDDQILDAFIAGAAGADIAAGLVERRTLEAAYPGNRRTWLPFRGGAYSGSNLFWLGTPEALRVLAIWRGIEQQRKKARAVLNAFGIGLGLMIGLRLLTLDQAARRVGRRLGLDAKLVVLPFAEACIDVDKPSDHVMAETILQKRNS